MLEPGEASSSQGSVFSEALSLGGDVAKGEEEESVGGDGEDGGTSGTQGKCKNKNRGKRKKKGWSQHKKGTKPRGQEDVDRQQKVTDKITKIKCASKQLRNPFDEMDIDTKREHAIFLYCEQVTGFLSEFEVAFASKSVSVKKKVAKRVGISVRT